MKARIIALSLTISVTAAAQTAPTAAPGTTPAASGANSKLVNNPGAAWNVYGSGQSSTYDDKGGPQGYPATRVTVTAVGKNMWDAGAGTQLTRPIAAGDLVFVAAYLRAPLLKEGETTAPLFLGLNGAVAPYEPIAGGTVSVGNQWKQYYAVGKATHAFAAGAVQATVHLAGAKQVIDLGPVRVFDFGLDADPARLPHN